MAKTHQPRSLDVEALLERFLLLSEREQLAFYKTARAYRSVELDDARENVALRRGETLEVIGRVAAHLGLRSDQAPSVEQFDQAPEEVRGDWRSGQVVRAWGRWRAATRAYLDQLHVSTAKREEIGGSFKAAPRRTPLESLRLFVESHPRDYKERTYIDWTRPAKDRPGRSATFTSKNALSRSSSRPLRLG